jgi:hypothetical protein
MRIWCFGIRFLTDWLLSNEIILNYSLYLNDWIDLNSQESLTTTHTCLIFEYIFSNKKKCINAYILEIMDGKPFFACFAVAILMRVVLCMRPMRKWFDITGLLFSRLQNQMMGFDVTNMLYLFHSIIRVRFRFFRFVINESFVLLYRARGSFICTNSAPTLHSVIFIRQLSSEKPILRIIMIAVLRKNFFKSQSKLWEGKKLLTFSGSLRNFCSNHFNT